MRISTNEMFTRAMDNFSLQQSLIQKVQEQISSGNKILLPSDDPIGMMQSLNYHYQFNSDDQFVKNGETAQSQLELEDSILESVTNIYQRFRELVVTIGNGSLSSEDRESLIVEMEQRLSELVGLANSRSSSGNYIFSGFSLNKMPVQQDANGIYQYYGDNGQQLIMLGESIHVPLSDQAQELFFSIPSAGIQAITATGAASLTSSGSGLVNAGTLTRINTNDLMINNIIIPNSVSDGVSTSDAMGSAIAFANAINAQYTQHGVKAYAQQNNVNLGLFTPGAIAANDLSINGVSIIDPTGSEATVIEAINSKTSLTGVVASQPGGTGTTIILTANDGRNIQLQTSGGSAARFANFNMSAGPLNQVQRAQVTLTSHQNIVVSGNSPTNAGLNYTTAVVSNNTGSATITASAVSQDAIVNSSYSIVFGAGGLTYSIFDDANPSAPIQGFSNQTYVPGQHIDFMGIRAVVSGVPNNGDSFGINLSPSAPQSIFTSFQNIINAARSASNDPIQLSYEVGLALSNINFAESELLNIRAQVGARLNIIESQKNYHESLKIISQKNISRIEDTDYSRVITQLSEYSFTLQAAQQSFVKVMSLSLFNYIR